MVGAEATGAQLTPVPSLRRATALDYTDNDEDAEKLLSFMDEAEEAKPDGADEWVATHFGRRELDSGCNCSS